MEIESVKVVGIKKPLPQPAGIHPSDGIIKSGFYFTCDSKARTQLFIAPGTPLVTSELTYTFDKIAWQPGPIPPFSVYDTPEPFGPGAAGPVTDGLPQFVWPGLPRHSIVFQFGGITSVTGTFDGGGTGTYDTDVFVQVNDDLYPDNIGTFSFWITSYAK